VGLMTALRQGWEANTCKLANLSLASCPLGPTGCGAVVANLLKCQHHTLRRLDLRDVRGGAGFNLLRTLLSHDSLLEKLVVLKSEWDTLLRTDTLDDSVMISKTLPRKIPLELPLRHALLYALSGRSKRDGNVSLLFPKDVVATILSFSVRRVHREVIVRTDREKLIFGADMERN